MRILNYEITKRTETRSEIGPTFTQADAALAEWLAISQGYQVTEVSEERALGLTGYYRAVNIVAGTIAGLPLKSYRKIDDERRERISTFLDNPAGPYKLTPFAWKEMVMLHLLNHGEAFLLHVYNNGGVLIGLWPIHPSAISEVRTEGFNKIFKISLADGTTKEYSDDDMTHVMGLTLDGIRGLAPISLFRQVIRTGLNADLVAAKSFSKGLLISGLVTTPNEDVDEAEAKTIKESLTAKLTGVDNAGDIAFINRNLKFDKWQMTNEDAQFIESREFQVTEFARMIGVPPHLLAQVEKQTSWGTGVEEQNLGLARFTLMGWTSRIAESLSTLLQKSRYVEFDYKGLLEGTPAQEIELIIQQVAAGLLTKDEARAILNRPPLPAGEAIGGDPETNGTNNV